MTIERAVVDTNVLNSAALSPHAAAAQIVDTLYCTTSQQRISWNCP